MQALAATSPPPPPPPRRQQQRRRSGAACGGRAGVPHRLAALDGTEQPYELDPNVWTHKPAWCQPWSIVGTGSAVVAGVWAVSGGSPGWTAAAALPVAAWWWLFLGIYPQQFREYAEGLNAQQRQLLQQRQQQLEEQRRRQQQQQAD